VAGASERLLAQQLEGDTRFAADGALQASHKLARTGALVANLKGDQCAQYNAAQATQEHALYEEPIA
jgi:hypothetical protein